MADQTPADAMETAINGRARAHKIPVRAKPNQGRNKAFLRATLLPRPGPNPAPETFKGLRDDTHPEPAQREGSKPPQMRPHHVQESRLQFVKFLGGNLARRSEVVL